VGLQEEFLNLDLNTDPVDVLGVYNLTTPNKASGPRLHLTGSYYEQSLILNNSEVPRMFTGFEKQFGSYNDSLRVAKTNYVILNRIEKFPSRPGYHYTLVVRDLMTGVIGIIENKHYESLAEEHGYFKPGCAVDNKHIGTTIAQGEVISRASSHDENLNYKYGVNANVAYISKKDNIEDGIIISEEFAQRVTYATIKTVEITLGFNDILLNIYGDDLIYKSFPDVFSDVKDGIFCAKRSIDHFNTGCNTTAAALSKIDTNDELYHGDGKVLDVEIFINSNAELYKDNLHRQQIINYYNIVKDYKTNVYKALEVHIKDKSANITVEANTRYATYKNYVDACNMLSTDGIKFSNGSGSFEFAYLKFTIGRTVPLSLGSKLTNRFGGKGVVCAVLPKELMPFDEYGNHIDVILNPTGTIGRSNSGQHYEHELNFIGDHVAIQIDKCEDLASKYKKLHTFYKIADAESSQYFEKYYKSLTTKQKHEYFANVVKNGIYVRQHPFTNITFENMKKLYMEFGVKPSKITTGVKVMTPEGEKIQYYKSICPVIVGKEYIMVLKHTTESKFSSVSVSDVNTLGLPHKNTSNSKRLPYRATPIKLGEMEVNIAINRTDPLIVNRLLAAGGSNLAHRDKVSKMLLEEDPLEYHDVNIKSEDIMDSIASDAFVAIMTQLGYSVYSDQVSETVEIGIKK